MVTLTKNHKVALAVGLLALLIFHPGGIRLVAVLVSVLLAVAARYLAGHSDVVVQRKLRHTFTAFICIAVFFTLF